MSAATGEPVGTAAEEAARLLDSLGGWFDPRTGPAAQDGPPADQPESAEPAQPPHGPTCRACPLCRGMAYLQDAHPDVLTHLAGAAQHLVAALRSLTEAAADGAGSAPDTAGSAAAPGADHPSRAVRIDVEADVEADTEPDAEPHTEPDTRPEKAAEHRASSATEQEQAP